MSTLERERGQQLYQHSLMMQQHPSMMAAGQGMMGPGMVGGPAGVLPGGCWRTCYGERCRV